MAASFMNPHRAIDYLFNPSLMPAPPAAPAQAAPTPAAAPAEGDTTTPPPAAVTPAEGAAPPPATEGSGSLDFLRNQPQVWLS